MKFSFVKSILILQSGWYFGAYFIVFYEQHTLNLHCNSFIYLGIFKYLLYRKVFNKHHFVYGIFFVYCFLFISIHYWVFFSTLCQYLGKMYLLVTCVAFKINGFFVLHVQYIYMSYKYSRICAPYKALFTCTN